MTFTIDYYHTLLPGIARGLEREYVEESIYVCDLAILTSTMIINKTFGEVFGSKECEKRPWEVMGTLLPSHCLCVSLCACGCLEEDERRWKSHMS